MYGVATQNGVGLGVGNIPTLTSLAYPQMLNAIVLGAFSGGAPGWLYDDSNMSTLFQDAAGTTPVTALEQPVGLQLDLSQGLVLGSELVTPAANRDFSSDTGYWSKEAGVTISGSTANWAGAAANYGLYRNSVVGNYVALQVTYTITSISSGGIKVFANGSYSTPRTTVGTYTEFIFSGSGSPSNAFGFLASAAGTTASIDNISVKQIAGNHRYQPTSANRPTWSARYNLLLATASLSTQSVTTVATNYVLYFTGSGTVTLSGTATGTLSAGSNTITCTAGTLTLTVSGSVLTADLRPSDQATGLIPTYQRVNTATDYDANGFPAGLRWNGSNSWMQNASVDFSGTNKLSVFVGVRKPADAQGMIFETSTNFNSNNGAMYLIASPGDRASWQFNSKGTTAAISEGNGTAPQTAVITGLGDISAPSVNVRVNGTPAAVVTTTQGTGNYGNYPAYFGARAGSSFFLNGLTFSNVCIGIALSASQIAAFEAWTNARARAYV